MEANATADPRLFRAGAEPSAEIPTYTAVGHGYAQTHLQLFVQAEERGLSDEELDAIDRAYALLQQLFGRNYRRSGKTFPAHLVGTASILLARDAHIELVAAAMLHAAYTMGRFPKVRRGFRRVRPSDDEKRETVRAAVGAGAEHLVRDYAVERRRICDAPADIASPAELPLGLGKVVVLHLANAVEHHLDLGTRFAAYAPSRDDETVERYHAEVARALGYGSLVDELDALRAATGTGD